MRLPAAALLLALATTARAHPGEVQLWVDLPDAAARAAVATLPLGFAEGQDGTRWRMVGQPGVEAQLDAAGLDWSPVPPPPPTPAGYTTPDELGERLAALASENAELVSIFDMGWSREGRPIVALRISATATPQLGWRILGAHHGDELSSAELALATAEALVDGHGRDPATTALLERDAVWVMPQVNPDGVVARTRSNADGVDLNRNYSHEWTAGAYGAGPAPFSEPETRAVRALSVWTALGAGLSMHAGETNLGWVWNHTTARTPDEDLLAALAADYLARCTTEGFWITNGADWYATNGDTNDWSYGRHGVLDYTLETTLQKTPPAADIDAFIDDHLAAVLGFLDNTDAVWGQVVAPDGSGLVATVAIDEAPGLRTGPDGRFGRPVAGTAWRLSVSAPGFETATVDATADALPLALTLAPRDRLGLLDGARLLARDGDGVLALDTDRALWLARPGELPVALGGTPGARSVPVATLAPGPWSLVDAAGSADRNTVFIGEHTTAPEVELVAADAAGITLAIRPAVRGVRAWAFAGDHRSPQALAVSTPDATTVHLALPALDPSAPLDVLLLAGGHQLALLDLWGSPVIDDPEPPDTGTAGRDTGPSLSSTPSGKATACGCAAGQRPAPLGGLVVLLAPLVLVTRRLRRPRP